MSEDGQQTNFPNIKQVAQRAGVSPSTASRVLAQRGYSSPAARHRVERAAKELGYEPHLVAQTLKSRSSRMVGVVIQDITNPFYSFVAKGAADAIRSAGFILLLSDSQEEPRREAESLRVMLRSRVAGMIITPTLGSAEALRAVQARGIAVVQVDRVVPGVASDTVLIDNAAGAYMATRHLIGLGHTRIGVIAGPRSLTTGRFRLLGFRAAMKERGIPVKRNHIKTTDYRRETGYSAAGELLDERPRPTAIFAHNNILAESLLRALAERKLRVPDDVAVIGFDDASWAPLVSPPLTVIRQPAYEIGAMAAELLVRRLANRDADPAPVHIMLQPTLVVRGSCGGAPVAATSEDEVPLPEKILSLLQPPMET